MAAHRGEDRRELLLDRIRAIPEGFVRTYGDLSPGAPRYTGTVLAHGPPDAPRDAGPVLARGRPDDVPWPRVVRSDGSLTQGARQRALLEAEGVPFRGERVDMRVARLP